MADDYAALRPVRTHGLFGAQIAWYRGWTGRFCYTLVYSLLGLWGPATPRFMPSVLLILWFAATVWAIRRIQSLSGRVSWANLVLCAGFLTFATLETTPNVYQSLYWQTAALTHFLPFIPFSLFVAVIIPPLPKGRKSVWYKFQLSGAGILAFVAGGFSDTYVVLQSCALVLSLLAVTLFADNDCKSRIRPLLVAGAVGSLLAFVIVAAAPGNKVRMAYFPSGPGGWDILRLTVRYSIGFVGRLLLRHPATFLLLLILPMQMRLRDLNHREGPGCSRQLCIRLLWVIPVTVILLIMCCVAPGVYALSAMIPERAQILLAFVFVCGTVLWSRTAGEYLAGALRTISDKTRQRLTLGALVALLLLTIIPLRSFVSLARLREEAQNFAADWDGQDAQLKTAKQNGLTDVTVPQIGDFQSRIGKGASDLHLRTDPGFWINRTTATYYGLTSVRASEDVASSR